MICLGIGDPATHAKAALGEMLKETGIAERDETSLAAFDRPIKTLGRRKGAPKKKRRLVPKRRK
jgi:hypothetical protein